MLHVPDITKNLISVAQFAKDNKVCFEFFPNFCNIKHQVTQQSLLRGIIKNGLYVFPPSTNLTGCTVNYACYKLMLPSLQLWHNRLGHCKFFVVKHVWNSCNVVYSSTTRFCEPCIHGKDHQLPFHTSLSQYTTPIQLLFIDI